jgi:hypothetical protein
MNIIKKKYRKNINIDFTKNHTIIEIMNVNLDEYEWNEIIDYFVDYNYQTILPFNNNLPIVLNYYKDTEIFEIKFKNDIDQIFYLHINRLIHFLLSTVKERPLWCSSINNGFNQKRIETPEKPIYFSNQKNIYISINIKDPILQQKLQLRKEKIQNYVNTKYSFPFHISLFKIYLNEESEIIKNFNRNSHEINNIKKYITDLLNNNFIIYKSKKEEYDFFGERSIFFALQCNISNNEKNILVNLTNYMIKCITKYCTKPNNISIEKDNNNIDIKYNNETIAFIESIYNHIDNNSKLHISIGKLRPICHKKIIYKKDNELKMILTKKMYKQKFEPVINESYYTFNNENALFYINYS